MTSRQLPSKLLSLNTLGWVALFFAVASGCSKQEEPSATTKTTIATPPTTEAQQELPKAQAESKEPAPKNLKLSLPQDFVSSEDVPHNGTNPTSAPSNLFNTVNSNSDRVKISGKPMTNIDKDDLANSSIEGGTLSIEIKTD